MKIKISIGDKYGKWTVIDNGTRNIRGATVYKCKCECGYQLYIVGASLYRGYRSRCVNCFNSQRVEETKKREIGQIYNGWEIVDLIMVKYKSRNNLTAKAKHICGIVKQIFQFYMLKTFPPRCKKCTPIKEDSIRRYKSKGKITNERTTTPTPEDRNHTRIYTTQRSQD